MSIINKKIDLNYKKKTFHHLYGAYKSNVKGTGMVYAESRIYAAGDPYTAIDRQTTAKKQELWTKQFEEEKTLRVLIVIQGGVSMNFHSHQQTKPETIHQIAYIVGQLTKTHNDALGYLIHTNDQPIYQPARQGNKTIHRCLADIQKQTYQGTPSPDDTAKYLQKHGCRHHLIIWISDQLITTHTPYLQALAKSNDIRYLHLFDPFEQDIDLNHFGASLIDLHRKGASHPITQAVRTTYSETFAEKKQASIQRLASYGICAQCMTTQDTAIQGLFTLFAT